MKPVVKTLVPFAVVHLILHIISGGAVITLLVLWWSWLGWSRSHGLVFW